MTIFQIFVIGIMLALIVHDSFTFKKNIKFRLLRLVVWSLTALSIAFPDLVSSISHFFGIERGADFASYLFIIIFILISFHFYSLNQSMRQDLTQVIRHLAISSKESETKQTADISSERCATNNSPD